jgi:hypothetical protein
MWVENWEFGVLLASKVERELLRKIWMQTQNGMSDIGPCALSDNNYILECKNSNYIKFLIVI